MTEGAEPKADPAHPKVSPVDLAYFRGAAMGDRRRREALRHQPNDPAHNRRAYNGMLQQVLNLYSMFPPPSPRDARGQERLTRALAR